MGKRKDLSPQANPPASVSLIGKLAATERADRAGFNVVEACRERWEKDRDPKVLVPALLHLNMPRWLVDAFASLHPQVSKFDAQDLLRWWWVKYGLEYVGYKWSEVYRYAAERCGEHISPAAVKRSYLKVEKAYPDCRSPDGRDPPIVIVADRGRLLRPIDADGFTVKAGTSVMVERRYEDGTLDLRSVVNGVEGALFQAHERDVKLRYNADEITRSVKRPR
jgi:hypothetical protein